MTRRIWSFLRTVLQPRGTAAFMAISLVVGVIVGVSAAALIGAIEGIGLAVEAIGDGTGVPKVVVLVALPVGVVLAWWIARRFAPEVAGDGVPETTAAVAIRVSSRSLQFLKLSSP